VLPHLGGNDPAFQVLFETDADARLVRVVIREPGRVETEFRFGNWEENIAIPEVKFHFQPPPGVSIVDEESLAGSIH
jgi:outer membrane lipoprotein-sorting protein